MKYKEMRCKNVNKQAKEILKFAEENGVQDNFLFANTFKNYLRQLDILDQLSASLEEDGLNVKKEYVKGRQNLYTHPALPNFNNTMNSASKTVGTLLKIIKTFGETKEEEYDPLMDIINGGDVEDE